MIDDQTSIACEMQPYITADSFSLSFLSLSLSFECCTQVIQVFASIKADKRLKWTM